ncbi:formate dehydrogenase subunit delta [Halomonas sp. PAMB 3232]|uniref:formate dehydrogenase subunit delta n=1 Tax=Halomonas sp. PAMB 3232 TaxID=3075221 RepID=UPI00289FD513|nr:formate dehydrogenase subunit delta [Halomonas sp. PAMB 3232]WNL39228.1 formate dehydrogenase subunit delta [Halomonas sp. PAMB 3232]
MSNNDDNLIHMVNQIAANLSGGRDDDTAASATCRHLETFWARTMKKRLAERVQGDATGFSPVARQAAMLLAERLSERQAS